MVIVSPLRIGFWDPFQMAFLWLINGGDPITTETKSWEPILQVKANSIPEAVLRP